ncbi:AMP-binding protein [Streptomyces sp. NPDC005865]|uniref:AMP-binding protein n=1 Tax=Streptomyces sp. NPDC005865 TaxID=3155453 RepID=UPI0033DE3ED8
MTENVLDIFARRKAERAGSAVLVDHAATRPVTWTFEAFHQECLRAADWMAGSGVTAGARTVILVRSPVDFLISVYAAFAVGAVPVLVDPHLPPRAVRRCLADAQPTVFLGDPLAHLARLANGWARSRASVFLLPPDARRRRHHEPKPVTFRPAADDTALIAFTSGSTGTPKGAVYTHSHLSAQLQLLREELGMAPGRVLVSAFLPFVLFGPLLGVTSVLPDMDFSRPRRVDPRKLTAALTSSTAAALLASPVVLTALSAHCAKRGAHLGSLADVYSFGASLPLPVLTRLRRALPPAARLHSIYGATECLPVSSVESRELLSRRPQVLRGQGVCLGRPVSSLTVRVAEVRPGPVAHWADSRLVPPGQIGEITVAGPNVSTRYAGNRRATERTKVHDGARVVHRTGDLGWIDDDGHLWFCGRIDHQIHAAMGHFAAEPIEAALDAVPGVRRCALVGIGPAGCQVPVLCVQPDASHGYGRRHELMVRVLAAAAPLPHGASIALVLFRRRLPVDVRHNSKIDRASLSRWAARALLSRRRSGRLRRHTKPSAHERRDTER